MPKQIKNSDVFNEKLGIKIKQLRVSKGLVRQELAKKIGVSFQQLSKYEDGYGGMSVCRLQIICKALDVPVTYFFANKSTEEQDVHSRLTIEIVRNLAKLTYKQQLAFSSLIRCMVEKLKEDAQDEDAIA